MPSKNLERKIFAINDQVEIIIKILYTANSNNHRSILCVCVSVCMYIIRTHTPENNSHSRNGCAMSLVFVFFWLLFL